MPVLDRQPVPAHASPGHAAGDAHLPPSLRGLPPRSVPETRPTPLQKHYVLVSAPALVLGAIDTFAQSQSLFKNPPYNSIAEFTPVGLAVEQPLLLTIRKDLPAENLKEFATYLKANQAKMQFASAGVGSAVHLACFQFTAAVGATVPSSRMSPSAAPRAQ